MPRPFYAANTLSTYGAGLKRFTEFCDNFEILDCHLPETIAFIRTLLPTSGSELTANFEAFGGTCNDGGGIVVMLAPGAVVSLVFRSHPCFD